MSNNSRDTPTNKISQYDFTNKKKSHKDIITNVLNKTFMMFDYKNLPENINKKSIENFLQLEGYALFFKHNNELYFLLCAITEYNFNFQPKKVIVNNPYLDLAEHTFDLEKDECVLIYNDFLGQGILPVISKYASLMVENEISMKIACINARIPFLIDTPDDRAKKSVEKLLKDVENGKQASMTSNQVLKSITTTPYSHTSSNLFTQLIENEQYLKATLLNEVGINANFNMKREALNTSETTLNEQQLTPLIENMFDCRKNGFDKVNEKFSQNIIVELNSIWKTNVEKDKSEVDNVETE